MKFRNHTALCAISAGALVLTGTVQAQDDAGGGALVTLDVSPTLRYANEGDESGVYGRMGIGLGITSQTASQSLSFNLGTALETGSDVSDEGINDPVLRFTYTRESRETLLTTSVRYQKLELDTSFLEAEDIEADIPEISTGTREDLDFDIGLEVGRASPLGAQINYSLDTSDYEGTDDADLIDRETNTLSGAVSLRFGPRITGRVTGLYEEEDEAEGGIDETRSNVGVGATFLVNPRLTADVALGYGRLERTGAGIAGEDVDDGLTTNIALTNDMRNGQLTGSLRSDFDESGRRNTIEVGRAIDLKRGSLRVSFGLSEQDDVDPIYGFAYLREFQRGQLAASLNQSFDTDSDGDQARLTLARVGYRQALTRNSGIEATLAYRQKEVTSGDEADSQRLDLGLTYNYALTEDWGLVSGVQYSVEETDGEDDDTAEEIFVGLRRTFSWRP